MTAEPISTDRRALLLGSAAVALSACAGDSRAADASDLRFASAAERRITDAQWRARLSPAAYRVLRHEDTERPGTSALNGEQRRGTFVCAGCVLPLFRSDWKYDSRTGWPSFHTAIRTNIGTKTDTLMLIPRTEYHCARCLGHQGHLFDDGPRPTGQRYCNNGVALRFVPA